MPAMSKTTAKDTEADEASAPSPTNTDPSNPLMDAEAWADKIDADPDNPEARQGVVQVDGRSRGGY